MCGAGGMMAAFAGFRWVRGLQTLLPPALPSAIFACVPTSFALGQSFAWASGAL